MVTAAWPCAGLSSALDAEVRRGEGQGAGRGRGGGGCRGRGGGGDWGGGPKGLAPRCVEGRGGRLWSGRLVDKEAATCHHHHHHGDAVVTTCTL